MQATELVHVGDPVRATGHRSGATFRLMLLVLVAMLAQGCGGGGSGPTRPAASDFETGEYFASGGLAPINASAAYVQGATGADTAVAVMGSGEVDITHPELDAKVSGTWGFDADTGRLIRTQGDSWFSRTGTAVAGLIVGKKNDRLLHGAAFGSRLENIDTTSSVTGTDTATIAQQAQANTAAALNFSSADTVLVDVPTSEPIGEPLRSTLISTPDARPGRILVTEAGDGGAAEPKPLGRLATDPALKGHLLVVGSVDGQNRVSSFSNRAGSTADFFVVAPGEGLTSLAPTQQLAVPLFGCCFPQCPSCTSKLIGSTTYAAALVTGAAAVLQEAFPFLSGAEIAGILLDSATDLGDPGADPVYGRGLINLAAAMEPVGNLSIPTGSTVTGSSAGLDESSLSLAPAFGDVALPAGILDEIIVLDDYDRPYRVSLGNRVGIRRRDVSIESLFDPSPTQFSMAAPGLEGAAFRLGVRRRGLRELIDELDSGSAVAPLGKDTALRLSWDAPAAPHFDVADPLRNESLFLSIHDVRMPQFDLLGEARGAALLHRVGTGSKVIVGWFEGEGVSGIGDERYRLTQALWRHDFGGTFGLGFGLGLLDERDTFLGSRSYGAFGSSVGAHSQFASLLGTYRFDDKTGLELGYVRVRTDVEARGPGLLNDWSTIQADALSAGLFRDDLFISGDRAGVRLSQPLRVRMAEATLTVPMARDVDGNLVRRKERVDMSPRGQEVDFEIAYARPVARRGTISGHALIRHEPDHDAGAGTDVILGVTARFHF